MIDPVNQIAELVSVFYLFKPALLELNGVVYVQGWLRLRWGEFAWGDVDIYWLCINVEKGRLNTLPTGRPHFELLAKGGVWPLNHFLWSGICEHRNFQPIDKFGRRLPNQQVVA